MSRNKTQGLVRRRILAEAELAEIKQLTAICESHEGLHMRLDWKMLQTRSGHGVNDFLYFVDSTLVGYLALDSWGIEEKELVGMVHPDHRRRGIFRALLAAAKEECINRGINKLILTCEHSSGSGQAFVQAVAAHHAFSEHEMVLGTFQERGVFDERLFFQGADVSNLAILVSVSAKSFGDPEEITRQRFSKLFQEPHNHFYLATFGEEGLGCREPVGMLRLDEGSNKVGIYGFGVLPDYRRRGYGRQMLEEAIRIIRAKSQKKIMLDVETDNTHAIRLYTSCGFEIKTTYDYYSVAVR